MDLSNFPKPFISIKKLESNLKCQKALGDRYLDLLSTYEKEMNKLREMEFFYYSKTRDNADGLKKDLENNYKLGITNEER